MYRLIAAALLVIASLPSSAGLVMSEDGGCPIEEIDGLVMSE
jgi:hypothetical protein